MRRMVYVSSRHSRNDDQTNSCGFSSISKVDGVRAALALNFLHRFGISVRAARGRERRVERERGKGPIPACIRVARFAGVQRKLLEIKLMSSSINRSLERDSETHFLPPRARFSHSRGENQIHLNQWHSDVHN